MQMIYHWTAVENPQPFHLETFFQIFSDLSLILKIRNIQKHAWNVFSTYFPKHKLE
jgi:hypothetical protein